MWSWLVTPFSFWRKRKKKEKKRKKKEKMKTKKEGKKKENVFVVNSAYLQEILSLISKTIAM